jgi:acetolactate synthase-1/2/3 large subunit
MVRQWQEFFYDKRYAATPMTGPDFVKLAEAYRLTGLRCNKRGDVKSTVDKTLDDKKTVVIDFVVEKEDTVFPMVPAGADLDKMIRRPKQDVMLESGSDKEWEMPVSTLPNVFAETKAEAKVLSNGRSKAVRSSAPARKAPKPAKSRR